MPFLTVLFLHCFNGWYYKRIIMFLFSLLTAEVSGSQTDSLLAVSLAKALCCILNLFFFFGLCRSAAQIFSFYFNLDLKVFCELDMIFKLQASIFFNFWLSDIQRVSKDLQGIHIFLWIMFHNTIKSKHIVHKFHSLSDSYVKQCKVRCSSFPNCFK